MTEKTLSLIELIDAALAEFDGCEINPSNYNHDDACNLNNGYVGLFQTLEEVKAKLVDSKVQGTLDAAAVHLPENLQQREIPVLDDRHDRISEALECANLFVLSNCDRKAAVQVIQAINAGRDALRETEPENSVKLPDAEAVEAILRTTLAAGCDETGRACVMDSTIRYAALLIAEHAPEPVSVDLEAGAKAIHKWNTIDKFNWEDCDKGFYRLIAKACADAWRLKYDN